MGVPQHKINLSWSENLAYAVGLITSDGCLSKDKRHLFISSKDLEMLENFKKSLSLTNKVGRYARGGEKEKRYFCITFGDVCFYRFLEEVGLCPRKSKTLKSVEIPNKFFRDFFRGLFDGDGSFYSYWDRRWPNSFGFKLSIASASLDFISWLKTRLTKLYEVKGYIHKGDGVYNLEYVKGDSRKLFKAMYHKKKLLFFSKKYEKIRSALEKDEKIGFAFLQKPQRPE